MKISDSFIGILLNLYLTGVPTSRAPQKTNFHNSEASNFKQVVVGSSFHPFALSCSMFSFYCTRYHIFSCFHFSFVFPKCAICAQVRTAMFSGAHASLFSQSVKSPPTSTKCSKTRPHGSGRAPPLLLETKELTQQTPIPACAGHVRMSGQDVRSGHEMWFRLSCGFIVPMTPIRV